MGQLSTNHKFCGECGSALPGGTAFCGECGTAVPKAAVNKKVEAEQKRPKAAPQTSQSEKQDSTTNVKSGFQIVPILLWAAIWLVAWLLTPIYFVFFWLPICLIAATLLQWFDITKKQPTAIMALITACSWAAFISLLRWVHLFFNPIPMSIVGFFVGAGLGWIIMKQLAKAESKVFSTKSIMKLTVGWALCGACAGMPYLYFPYKAWIITALLITLVATIVLKPEK